MNVIRITPAIDYYFYFADEKYNLSNYIGLLVKNTASAGRDIMRKTKLVVGQETYICTSNVLINNDPISNYMIKTVPKCFTITVANEYLPLLLGQ